MKLLFLAIISFLSTFSNFPPKETIVSQSFPLDHPTMSIKSTLVGTVDVIYVDDTELQVETIISGLDADVLQYAIQKGHFKLTTDYSWSDASLTLEEKRINTILYSNGQVQKPQKRYRIKVPRQVNFIH